MQAPDHVEARGSALAEAAGERGLSALLARRGTSPYRPGMASPDRLRIALRRQAQCVVAGIAEPAAGPLSLVLAEFAGGTLTCCGQVPGPRHIAVHGWLLETAARIAAPGHVPAGAHGISARWLRPAMTATVAHRGRLRDGTLSEPTLIAVRDDVDTAWCVRRESVPPPEDVVRGRFAPTVLLPLPLDAAALVPRPAR